MKREEERVEAYFGRLRDARNAQLSERMRRERTFEELLKELLASGGLNMEERERARADCVIL